MRKCGSIIKAVAENIKRQPLMAKLAFVAALAALIKAVVS